MWRRRAEKVTLKFYRILILLRERQPASHQLKRSIDNIADKDDHGFEEEPRAEEERSGGTTCSGPTHRHPSIYLFQTPSESRLKTFNYSSQTQRLMN